MRKRMPAVGLFCAALFLLGASSASANWIALTGLGAHGDGHGHWVRQVAVEPEGKVVLGSRSPRGGFAVERVDPDGTLDRDFGTGGSVATAIDGESMAVQPGGGVIVAGSVGEGSPRKNIAVTRYLSDGTVDRTFGDGGLKVLPKGLEDTAQAVALQPDGTIVLAGLSGCDELEFGCGYYPRSEVILIRLRPDGGLLSRTRFKAGGSLTLMGDVIAMAVGSRGQIVVAADSYGYKQPAQLIRFRPDGRLQARFGKGGAIPIPGKGDRGALGLQPDDRPLIAGFGLGGGGMRRLEPGGATDLSFGTAGSVECASSVAEYSTVGEPAVAELPDRRLLASGGRGECGLVRYLSDGSVDPSFGIGGRVDPKEAIGGAPEALAAGPGDAAVVVRWQDGVGFRIARYSADGDLDPSFGVGGVAAVPGEAATFDQANALLGVGHGKLLAVGTSTCADRSCGEFALVRYRADGRLDRSFGHGGLVRTPLEGVGVATSAALRPDGGIVVGGAIGTHDQGELKEERLALARYRPDGSLDRGFGKGGIVTVPSARGEDVQVNAVAIAPDGDIVAAGEAGCTDSNECRDGYCSECGSYVVARFHPGGAPVRGFGRGGVLRIDVGHNDEDHDAARAVAIQPDGEIVVAGRSNDGFGLLRLAPGGRLDRSFGNRGIVRTSFSVRLRDDQGKAFWISVNRPGSSLALLRDGKILVAGGSETMKGAGLFSKKPQNHGAIVRYRRDGSIDPSFGDRGLEDVEGLAIRALAVDRCGRIAVAGVFSPKPGFERFGVARRLPSGEVDRGFSKGIRHRALGTAEDSHANAVALGPREIVAAGVARNSGAGDDFALVAFPTGRTCGRLL